MNRNKTNFEKHLKKAGVSDELTEQIVNVPYRESADEKQDNQKALGLKLRVKEVVTSVFGDPPQCCSFLMEIVGDAPKKGEKKKF